MKYNGLSYFIGEGFKNIFKNTKSTAISIMTMICTMFLFGIFFSIGVNVSSILEQVQMKQGMEVFVYDEITDEQKNELEAEIKKLDGVNTVTYKNKQQALDSLKEQMKDYKQLLEGYEGENNVFPASFVVTLTDLEKSESIQDEIKSEMLSRNTDEVITGEYKIRWKEVVSSRFDSKSFKDKYSDLYNQFLKTTTTKRFTIA